MLRIEYAPFAPACESRESTHFARLSKTERVISGETDLYSCLYLPFIKKFKNRLSKNRITIYINLHFLLFLVNRFKQINLFFLRINNDCFFTNSIYNFQYADQEFQSAT